MKTKALIRTAFAAVAATVAAIIAAAADLPPAPTAGAYDEKTIAAIETRAGDDSYRMPDNPGGWIETRPCDADDGSATIDTVKKVGFMIDLR